MSGPVLPQGFVLDADTAAADTKNPVRLPPGFTLDTRPQDESSAFGVLKQFVANIPRGIAGSVDFANDYLTPLSPAMRAAKKMSGRDLSLTGAFDASPLKPDAPSGAPERYAATIGETMGGAVLPTAGWMGAARSIAQNAVAAPATGLLGRMVQGAAQQTVASPGRAIAYDVASATTGGGAQQYAKDAGAGPVGQTVAALGGSLVPMAPSLLAAPMQRARAAIASQGQTGAYTRMASQLPDGDIDLFANQVATGAERNTQAIQRRTLDILGEEMERAGQDRGQAIQSTVARIVAEAGVSPATARDQIRRLTAVHADSPLLMSEYAAAAPSNAIVRSTRNIDNMDLREVARPVDSGAHMIIDDLANGSGGSSAVVRNAINARNLDMSDVARERLNSLAPLAPDGRGPRTIQDLDQMQEGARRAAQMEYQAAYQGATNNHLLVSELPRILNTHAQRMYGRSGLPADSLRNAIDEFMITRPDGQRVAMMTLQQLQDARGSLRDQIEVARRAGNRQLEATLQPLYRDITSLMERANPQWATANRRWADNAIDTTARELGEAFSLQAGPRYRQQVQQYRALAPEAQEMVQVEFLQKLFDRLDNLPDTHDVAKLFRTDHIRHAIRELFGDQAAIDIARLTRDAAIATRSGRMLGNSQTHIRGMRQREADADTGVLAAAQDLNTRGIRSALMERAWALLTERRNRPLAEIATTPMRDTAEVARHIHNMRVARDFVRRVETSRPRGRAHAPALTTIGAAATAEEQR